MSNAILKPQELEMNHPVSNRLLSKLRCAKCHEAKLDYKQQASTLDCPNCGSSFAVGYSVPSVMVSGTETQEWNPWDREDLHTMGDSYYKRSTGEMEEKEASRSFAKLLKRENIYSPGDEILDIGCATGHFLRSFRTHPNPEVKYSGIDATGHYLKWGAEIYGPSETVDFTHCDALNLPYKDNAFDIVVVNLFHSFPNAAEAVAEVMRVAKKKVVWRTPVGPVNYVMRVYIDNDYDQIGVITPELTETCHVNYLIYTEQYIRDLVKDIGGQVVHFERDTDFGSFDNSKVPGFEAVTTTKVVGDMQLNGCMVLDWSYFVIDSSAS